MKKAQRINLIISITLAAALIISSLLIGNAFINRNQEENKIVVTGLGKKDFDADLIVWSADFSRKNMELKTAYTQLDEDRKVILDYLNTKGVSPEQVVFLATDISKDFDYVYDQNGKGRSVFTGFRLTQSLKIESKEVDKIELLAREITELINSGVELYSGTPEYYYTSLTDLKLEMVASATEDAYLRAELIAKNSNSKLGDLKSARMGVFQIIARNSSEDYSWGGTFNTSSKQKTATITMKLEFGVK